MIDAEVNSARLEASIVKFAAATRRTVGDVLRDVMKALVRDIVKLAPPFKSLSVRESFGEQRRIGEQAVKSDIERVFLPLESLRIYNSETRLGKEIKRATDNNRKDVLEILFQRSLKRGAISPQLMDAVDDSNFLATVNPADHKSQRNKRGRVRKDPRRFAVRQSAIDRYVKTMQKRVGKLKAGFSAAAQKFGVSLPSWIRRHSNGGQVVDQSNSILNPFILLRNTVSYVADQNSTLRFAAIAMRNQAGKIERQLEAKLKGLWK